MLYIRMKTEPAQTADRIQQQTLNISNQSNDHPEYGGDRSLETVSDHLKGKRRHNIESQSKLLQKRA